MADTYRVLLNGTPAVEDFYAQIESLDVEENIDLPGALELKLPISRTDEGDLSFVNEDSLQPFAAIAVVVAPEDQSEACVFDGYVLSHRLHVERGITSSTLHVWAQDASWLMNLEEKTREWPEVTDGQVANAIFSEYGFVAAAENTEDDTPPHAEAGHTLMQRGTDAQFLRMLARRAGKFMRVVNRELADERHGIFAAPDLSAEPVCTLTLSDPEAWTTAAIDVEWDVTRPSQVKVSTGLFTDPAPEGASADAKASGLSPLDEHDLATFAGRPISVLLTTVADDAGELGVRARALLRDSNWFIKCEGETSLARLRVVLRAGAIVNIDGLGSVHSGKYCVWSVRHSFRPDSHQMRFTLYRNAAGPTFSGGGLL